MSSSLPLIVITGPTASGKSALAMELCERFGGEIICADSRTIYKGMDVGTAKPTKHDQARIRHHLLDVVEPGERFTMWDFKRLAEAAIADIRARNKVPFMVGGTGLYIDSVVLNYNKIDTNDLDPGRLSRQNELYALSIAELQSMIKKQHLTMPYNLKNRRHLVAVLLRGNATSTAQKKPADTTFVVSITTEKAILEQKIAARTEHIFSSGVVKEARKLSEKYGWENEAMTGNIYPIIREYMEGRVSLAEAKELSSLRDRQLVKKQITWLKRHSFVRHLPLDEAHTYIANVIKSASA